MIRFDVYGPDGDQVIKSEFVSVDKADDFAELQTRLGMVVFVGGRIHIPRALVECYTRGRFSVGIEGPSFSATPGAKEAWQLGRSHRPGRRQAPQEPHMFIGCGCPNCRLAILFLKSRHTPEHAMPFFRSLIAKGGVA